MKVLNVVDGAGWTGGVEQAYLLSLEMRRRGIDASLAVHRGNPLLGEAERGGIPVRAYDGTGRGRLDRFRELSRMLDEGCDAVIGHKPGAVRHLIAPVAMRLRRPLFVGVRRVSFPVSPLTVYRFPGKIVAVAEKVKKVLLESGLPERKIRVIPSGVDLERFQPSEKLRQETRKILGVGGSRVLLNLAKFVPEQKGQRHLFEALAELKREDGGVKLVLAGLETDGEGARKMTAEMGLHGETVLLGFRRDVPEIINAADVFVFPSLPGLDAIAGSVLQAMACRKIVVASAVGGIPEYLRHGENGFLVPPGDSRALAESLRVALNLQEEERERMGGKAKETVEDRYSTGAMADSYLQVLEEEGLQSRLGA